MENPTVIEKNGRFYKVEYLVTRLNSSDPNNIYLPLDSNKLGSLDMYMENGYKTIIGGKKSRKNRKHKTKSATKRRTARKHAY